MDTQLFPRQNGDPTNPRNAPGQVLQSDQTGTPSGRLLTISEVAEWLGVSKAWVYDHVTRKRPRLPCIRFGELTRFKREEIERFIQEHANPNGAPST
jgi:excisionase family DNA binding protein